jgi:PAS domain S-box-containing protein
MQLKYNGKREQKTAGIIADEEKIRGIFDSSPNGILVIDADGKITECNQATINMFGVTGKKELIGKNALELAYGKNKDKYAKLIKNLIEQGHGTTRNVEYIIINKNGRKIQGEFSASATKDATGKISGYVVITGEIAERKKAEKKLRVSEKKYRALYQQLKQAKQRTLEEKDRAQNYLDVAGVLLLALDVKGNITLLNRRGCAILGCNAEDVVGKNWFTLFVPQNERAQQIRLFKSRIATLSNDELQEALVETKKGEKRIISWRHTTLKDFNGQIIGTLSSGEDITENKKLQAAIAETQAQFRSIVENSTDMIMLTAPDGTILYVSPACRSIVGYGPEEFIGKTPDKIPYIFHVDDFEKANTAFQRFLWKEKGSNFEYRLITKNGEVRWISHSWTPIVENQQVKMVVSLIRDVTECKHLEEQLREERNKLESITENINAALILISKDYEILWLNQPAKKRYGDVTHKKCYFALHGTTNDTVCPECGVKKVLNGAEINVRGTTLKNNGQELFLEIAATPIKDKDSRIFGALELISDVTETKHLQTELATYSRRLEELVEQRTLQLKQTQAKLVKSERLAAIGELAGMVGHDLRNPLTSMKAAAYFLKTKYAATLDPAAAEMLSTIEKSVDYSNKIVNDLLDYSREIKLEITKTTPKELLKTTLSMLAIPNGIEIIDKTEDKPEISVDLPKMSRVCMNIIKNAFDAMPNGGILTVTSKETKDGWKISFSDTGIGMGKDTLSSLWVPLFTTKAKGMGFGLAICKRIVEAHGGKILAESTQGKGTVFTLTFPAQFNSPR